MGDNREYMEEFWREFSKWLKEHPEPVRKMTAWLRDRPKLRKRLSRRRPPE